MTLHRAASSRSRHPQPPERHQSHRSSDHAFYRLAKPCSSSVVGLATGFFRGVRACNVAMHKGSPQAMLVAAAAGFSAGVEAGYRFAQHVDDLGPPVDPETTVRVVPDRIERCGVERRFFDLVHGRMGSASELRIAALVHIGVPFRDGLHKITEGNSLEFMSPADLRPEFLDRIGAEEEA